MGLPTRTLEISQILISVQKRQDYCKRLKGAWLATAARPSFSLIFHAAAIIGSKKFLPSQGHLAEKNEYSITGNCL